MEFVNGQNLYRAHKFDWNFFTPVTGCTDSSAYNYDPQSNVDDGSCFYQISIYMIHFLPQVLLTDLITQ